LKKNRVPKSARPWVGRAALCALAALTALILIQAVFFNSSWDYSLVPILLLLAAFCAGALCASMLLRGKAETLLRYRFRILAAVLVLLFALQCAVGLVTRQEVDHDYGKVFNGAVLFATQGDVEEFQTYRQYYHHCSNNAGSFVILQGYFRLLAGLGITDFYGAAVVTGHLLFTAAILLSFLYLDMAFGGAAALASLGFWVCYLPVWFQSSIVYTDTLSVWTAPLVLFLHAKAVRSKKLIPTLLFYAAAGAALVIGAEIKATVLICGAAVLFEILLSRKEKRLLAGAAAAVLVFAAGMQLAGKVKEAVVLDPERLFFEELPG